MSLSKLDGLDDDDRFIKVTPTVPAESNDQTTDELVERWKAEQYETMPLAYVELVDDTLDRILSDREMIKRYREALKLIKEQTDSNSTIGIPVQLDDGADFDLMSVQDFAAEQLKGGSDD